MSIQDDYFGPSNDEFKSIVDGLYEEGGTDKVEKPKMKDPEELGDSAIVQASVEKALEELEMVRQGFLDFQEEIANTALFPYLYKPLSEFADACMDLNELIKNEIADAGDSKKQAALMKLRAKMLASVYKKYKQ